MADFDDSDHIAPYEDSASVSHGGDWSKGSDEEGDLPSSPSEYASPLLSSNDASRLKPATVSTRAPAQSKPSASTHSSKEDVEKPKAVKKDGDAGPTKHKQPSRRLSGHQNSSSYPHDDRVKPSSMSYSSRSSHPRPYRRNDDRDATLTDVLTVMRTMAAELTEARVTMGRLETELKEYKNISIQNQGEILRVCQAWDDRDGQYAAHGEADHSDEASQYSDESIPQEGAGSSDTAYDGSRDVSKAPADERQPVREAETPDQEMVAFEDDDHKSVNPIHDDEREPSRKRQRVETANDQQNGAQTNGWVPRYTSQQSYPPRKNHHPYNNGYNNQRGGYRSQRGGRFQNQGHHAPSSVGPYMQNDFGNPGAFRQQRPKQFTPHSNGPAFTPHPQNNGPFNAPQPPVQRRNSTFVPNPTPAFIPNPNYVPDEGMGYGPQQAPPPQMGFNGPPMHGVKRPFQADVQYGGEEYMQQPPPPPPPRPQWQQGPHVQGNFAQRPLPRRQLPQQHQQPRPPLTARIGV